MNELAFITHPQRTTKQNHIKHSKSQVNGRQSRSKSSVININPLL